MKNNLTPKTTLVLRDDAVELELDRAPFRLARGLPNVKVLVNEILHYYQRTKGVGHTRSLLSGTGYIMGSPIRPTVVAHDETYGRMISPGNSVSLANFPKWAYQSRAPLLWDNAAIILLCESFLDALEAQQLMIDGLQSLINDGSPTDEPLTLEGEATHGTEHISTGRLLEGEEIPDNPETGSPG